MQKQCIKEKLHWKREKVKWKTEKDKGEIEGRADQSRESPDAGLARQ